MFARLFLHAWICQNSLSRKIILKVSLRRRDFNSTPHCLTSCSGMHLLPEGVDKVEGAPNFRQVNGFPVFGVGQPTEEGFLGALEKVAGSTAEPPEKILWFNVRKEPVVYINGSPYAPRDPAELHKNISITFSVDQTAHLEQSLVGLTQELAEKAGGMLKVHKDLAFCENPLEREEDVLEVKPEKVESPADILAIVKEKGFPNLEWTRLPANEERAPAEYCFDMMTKLLKEIPAAVPCVFSDQIGRGRTTNAMVLQFCKHLFHSKDTHSFSCKMFPSIIETHLKPEGDCLSHKRNTDHDGA